MLVFNYNNFHFQCSPGLLGLAPAGEDGGVEEGGQQLGQGAQQRVQKIEAGTQKEN